ALRDGQLVPIVFASAKTGAGIDKLLHFTASLLPSPLEGNPRPFVRGEESFTTEFDADKPVLAHVFRVTTDPFSAAMAKLQEEDPCFVMERIAATGETVLRGLGELHLRVVLEKLQSHYGIELLTAPPKVAYKETITSHAEGHCRHKKQTGGAGQFGEVYLRVTPLPVDHPTGFEFVNSTVGGSIPKQFMPAIEKGVRQALDEGVVAGYPMIGVRVEVYDGKHHDVDSKEIAFITAGRKAFVEAVRKAAPALLEPFVEVEVTAPSRYLGDITSDLSTHRGRVNDSA
ncbi:fusA_2, partial [Symbiodinium sp. CCMP2456]